jgi:hypothetical protein
VFGGEAANLKRAFATRAWHVLSRNHQERTAVSGREGYRFLLGRSKDLGQSPHNDDLAMAPLLARMDFDPIDEQTKDLYNLWACRLILQQVLQPRYLPAVKIR